MEEKLRVLVADDHAVVRQGLVRILEETGEMCVVGEAEDGDEAVELTLAQMPDVVLMDVSMPSRNGIDALKRLRRERPRTPVLILSMYPEEQYAIRALKAGAAGYLTKQSAPEQLVTAIRQVAQGHKYVSDTLAEALANKVGDDHDGPLHERLSDREYQTLCMIASGKTLTQIAEALQLSVKTISVYRARLIEKTGLKNNAEITHYGLKNGLVE